MKIIFLCIRLNLLIPTLFCHLYFLHGSLTILWVILYRFARWRSIVYYWWSCVSMICKIVFSSHPLIIVLVHIILIELIHSLICYLTIRPEQVFFWCVFLAETLVLWHIRVAPTVHHQACVRGPPLRRYIRFLNMIMRIKIWIDLHMVRRILLWMRWTARLLRFSIIIDGTTTNLLTAVLVHLGLLLLMAVETSKVAIAMAVLLWLVLTHPLTLMISMPSIFGWWVLGATRLMLIIPLLLIHERTSPRISNRGIVRWCEVRRLRWVQLRRLFATHTHPFVNRCKLCWVLLVKLIDLRLVTLANDRNCHAWGDLLVASVIMKGLLVRRAVSSVIYLMLMSLFVILLMKIIWVGIYFEKFDVGVVVSISNRWRAHL